MKLNISWSPVDIDHESSGEHYRGTNEGQLVGELVVDPKLVQNGKIIGAFSVNSSKIFDQVAVSAALFAVQDGEETESAVMPQVVQISGHAGLITQPSI